MSEEKEEISDDFSIVNELKKLRISDEESEVNILLLGETGVGKSTFINTFFNYIRFSSLHKAQNGNLHVVIPSQFTVSDENYQEHVIQVGSDHNETIEVGASGTQACRSYVYPVEGTNLRIRLIDTPGIGDTRGIDHDNINFEKMLSFIAEFKHLNAICVFLKPNNQRLTVMFQFCIKQLLSRLEKSAGQNLIFVFTNTRSTFYRPGETLPALKKLLESVNRLDILCEKKNIFCIDNECFRFLAALQNKVQFSASEVMDFDQSWTQSAEECLRMIKYIVGDEDNLGLIPHEVKNTISINEARRLVVQLSRPLAEISQLIQDNIRALDLHQRHLSFTKTMLSQLHIPIVDLKVTKLSEPATVCLKCSTVYQDYDKKKLHYEKCHAPCYLKQAPKEIIGQHELMYCSAMNQNGECCNCYCGYDMHTNISYEMETYKNKLENTIAKNTNVIEEQVCQIIQNLILEISKRLSMLNEEKDVIIKTTAMFACFLKINAIASCNDAYQDYLQFLIYREKYITEASDFEMITQLEEMLQVYTEQKTAMMNSISEVTDSNAVIKTDDILTAITSLYSLEIFGLKIKELFEAQGQAPKNEKGCQTEEFVYVVNHEANTPTDGSSTSV